MPFDNNGKFKRIHNWEEDRVNDIDIVSDRMDEEDDGFATGLSNCVVRDGRASMTGNLKMGSFQIKEVADGTLSKDAVNKSQLDTVKSDLTTALSDMLATLYPVGSIYIGTQSSCPLSSLISGSSWELVSNGRALWTGNGSNANSTVEAGLPNIIGTLSSARGSNTTQSGALSFVGDGGYQDGGDGSDGTPISGTTVTFNAQNYNSIYGNSTTVQPPAYVVNVWRRTA